VPVPKLQEFLESDHKWPSYGRLKRQKASKLAKIWKKPEKKLISRERVEINGRGKKYWSQNDMLHQISFESSYFENGDTPKMQKIEWGFISQILGANFSKSACFIRFLPPLRIGRKKAIVSKNSAKSNDEIFRYGG
jgi:hypothetical protein